MITLGPGKYGRSGAKWILEVFIYLKPESTGSADKFLWVMTEREGLWIAIIRLLA